MVTHNTLRMYGKSQVIFEINIKFATFADLIKCLIRIRLDQCGYLFLSYHLMYLRTMIKAGPKSEREKSLTIYVSHKCRVTILDGDSGHGPHALRKIGIF